MSRWNRIPTNLTDDDAAEVAKILNLPHNEGAPGSPESYGYTNATKSVLIKAFCREKGCAAWLIDPTLAWQIAFDVDPKVLDELLQDFLIHRAEESQVRLKDVYE